MDEVPKGKGVDEAVVEDGICKALDDPMTVDDSRAREDTSTEEDATTEDDGRVEEDGMAEEDWTTASLKKTLNDQSPPHMREDYKWKFLDRLALRSIERKHREKKTYVTSTGHVTSRVRESLRASNRGTAEACRTR
jgi:hypothetical protein